MFFSFSSMRTMCGVAFNTYNILHRFYHAHITIYKYCSVILIFPILWPCMCSFLFIRLRSFLQIHKHYTQFNSKTHTRQCFTARQHYITGLLLLTNKIFQLITRVFGGVYARKLTSDRSSKFFMSFVDFPAVTIVRLNSTVYRTSLYLLFGENEQNIIN